MSTTLTNGLKLPDKGSVDWYADMQNNYQILDGAVGTIAEHTTQIAGKAPLVHTHTKSDVTDLFNSANTWTGGNTFSDSSPIRLKNNNIEKGVQPTVFQAQNILFKDKNNSDVANIRHIVTARGTNSNADGLEFSVANKFANGALDPTGTNTVGTFRIGFWTDGQKYIYNEFKWRSSLIPFNNQAQDIGTSANQWNNLYAKNYYYNGIAWGLDKANTWTDTNTFSITLKQVNSAITKGTNPQSDINAFNVYWGGTGVSSLNNALFTQRGYVYADGSTSYILYTLENVSGGTHTSLSLTYDPNDTIKRYALMRGDFRPYYDNSYNLGTSTNKWKSFNGLNPGALSLPDNSGYTNISGNITDLTGAVNSYTPPSDGYVMVNVNPDSNNYAYVSLERVTVRSSSETTSGKNAMAAIPVIGGKSIDISVIGASIAQARFTPCQGNV